MQMNRRGFLGGILATGAAPMLFNGCANGFMANRRINVAVIGCGRIATGFEIPCVLKRPDLARIVALCDLDRKRLAQSQAKVEKHYADGGKVWTTTDYKELCARKDIDAVMICLPDFWHALVATTAICSGKHVWLQKPFTQTIREGRLLANLAKKYGTVLQVGSQQRSWNHFAAVTKAVREGVLGQVKRVEVGLGIDPPGGSIVPEAVPATFDYATWLGPTDPTVPYNQTRCHSQTSQTDRPGWIELMPYGWGMITNWGAHHLDIARWGLGAEGPESVSGTCTWLDTSGGKLWNAHEKYDLHFAFNGGKTDVYASDKFQQGVKFIGENGDWLWCTRGTVKVTPSDPEPRVRPGDLGPLVASKPSLMPKDITRMAKGPLQTHIDNWLEAVLDEDPTMTVTNAESGHRSTALSSLGMMCMLRGRGKKDGASFAWDVQRETTGNAEIDKLMTPFARDKFDLKVNLAEFGLDFNTIMKG